MTPPPRRHCGCGSVPAAGWIHFEFAQESLQAAGFRDVRRCAYRETASAHADIVALDNRPRETLFVEALA